MEKLAAIFCMLLSFSSLLANTEKVGGYTWTYRINGNTAKIYNDDGFAAITPSPTGAVTIPSTLGGKPVTSIGISAFDRCSGLTSVTIPSSVTSIGGRAFYGCSGLTSVMLPDGVKSIGGDAFFGCSGLTSVRIPDSVTSIGQCAFYGCSGLTSVRIPDRVTSIEWAAFSDCSGLTRVTIPDSVTNIEAAAFWGCRSLTSVMIPNSVAGIGRDAFSYCSGLKDVTVPQCVLDMGIRYVFSSGAYSSITNVSYSSVITNIGSYAFSYCSGLTRVTIPDSVTSIGDSAFYGCSGLASVYITDLAAWCRISFSANPFSYAHDLYLNGSLVTDLMIPDSATSIGSYTFSYCSSLTSVTIPSSVAGIGSGAFYGCSGIKGVEIPESVTSVEQYAFYGCSGLTSVTIPDSVTSIGCYAFEGCSGLKNVTVPQCVLDCQLRHVFPSACSSITNVTYSSMITNIGYGAFYGCKGLMSVTIPDGVTSIGDSAFYCCSELTSVKIPPSVTYIGLDAFYCCDNMKEVHISDLSAWCRISFVSYGSNPLEYYTNGLYLNGEPISGDVKLPEDLTRVSYCLLAGCSGITSVTIPAGVTSIGDYAFYGCRGLTSVTIPDSVTSIGYEAFYGCTNVREATVPGNACGIPFGNVSNLVISAGTTNIRYMAFSGCSGLTSVTIVNDVTIIGDYAFSDCSGLKEVWLPEKFRSGLNWSVFNGCPSDMTKFYYDNFVEVLHETLTAEDSSEVNVVLVATNACKVTFDWMCSCEPLRKGKMRDYLSFSVDGVQQDAIFGEVDWTAKEFVVEGNGEHVLRWTYQKDASGSEGEDCGRMRNVRVVPHVTLTFLPGYATVGTAPESMTFYADLGTVYLPERGTLAWPKHTFLGWSDGETVYSAGSAYPCDSGVATLTAVWARNELAAPVISAPVEFYGDTATVSISAETGTTIRYTLDGTVPAAESAAYSGPFFIDKATTIRAIAVRDDYFDSPEALVTVTKGSMTFGEAVNAPALAFTTDSGTGWWRVKGMSPDGYSLRSGVIGHNATSQIDTVVSGEGVITFSCKVSGEVLNGEEVYDGLAFLIDGVQQGDLKGNVEWVTNTFNIVGHGDHTLSWLYIKDENDEFVMADDCAWLDCVTWTPGGTTVDAGDGKTVTVPGAWLSENTTRAAMDTASNGRKVWECYALGLDPEIATNDFKITSFPMKADGTPDLEHIVFDPPQSRWNIPATYKVKGAANLDGPWQEVGGGGLGETALPVDCRFFKVEVVLP